MRFFRFFALLCSLWIITLTPGPARAAEAPTTVVVDWTRATGKVNRPIFSTQGFMQVYTQPNPLVLDTFKLLNPDGTMTRLETYIHQMEPGNDNDDPDSFDWDRLNPGRMIRFIDDREAFERVYHDELGMETLSLLCYNVEWNVSGNDDRPIRSNEEWAEFAASVVETYNGRGDDYRLNVRYIQIWNEPNMGMFYTGTPESYYDLFNTVAERIHRDYPGVMVGGPTITHSGKDPAAWMAGFLENCGRNTDFLIFHHYGPQGQGHQVLIDSVRDYATRFRAIPGKEHGRVMITETDAWFQGWEKMQFILDRQFGFLAVSDLLLAVHHFCCLAYNESGNHVFGIVDEEGGVLGGTFWPYWLFRNYSGEDAYGLVTGDGAASLHVAASFHENKQGQRLATAVLHNHGDAPVTFDLLCFMPATGGSAVLAEDQLTADSQGVKRVERVARDTTSMKMPVTLAAGEARAYTLRNDGSRHFAFSDLNNQETPWIGLVAESDVLDFGSTVRLRARILNTTLTPVSGDLVLRGLPGDWETEVVAGEAEVRGLEFGQSREVVYTVRSTTILDAPRIAAHVAFVSRENRSEASVTAVPHSIPVTLHLPRPATTFVLPDPIHAIAGETNRVELQITNDTPSAFEGRFEINLPDGMKAGDHPVVFSLDPDDRTRFAFPFDVDAGVKPGDYEGKIEIAILGTTLTRSFRLSVSRAPVLTGTVPVDLERYLNFDPVAYITDTNNTDDMGLFKYPADYTPSGRSVSVRGIEFAMPSLDDGRKCAVLPLGQRIDVTPDNYGGIAYIGFGHDGKHPGTWILHYEDGTTQEVESEIPEWCSPAPANGIAAFNAPFRYMPNGQTAGPPCQLWAWFTPADATRKLVAIELPTFDRGAYIFAITLLQNK